MNSTSNSQWHTIERINGDIYFHSKEKQRSHIFLHGLGDSPEGFYEFFKNPQFNFTDKHTDIILLRAPTEPVSVNMGMPCTSWFDIYSLGGSKDNFNYDDAEKNRKRVEQVIQKEIDFFKADASKVFVGGFSQGAAMSLNIYLKHEKQLGGAFIVSGFLFPQTKFTPRDNYNILIAHCEDDQMLPYNASMKSYLKISSLSGVKLVTTKGFGHTINNAFVTGMKTFFKNIIL